MQKNYCGQKIIMRAKNLLGQKISTGNEPATQA
jgi:hypothetical protein